MDQAANTVIATRTVLTQLAALAVHYGLSLIGAIILLVGGWLLSGLLSRWAYRGLSKIHGIDETLARFFEKVIHYGMLVLVFVMVLGQFGVQTTSIVAALGAAGLAIGLALQGTLQNIAAGIMLLALRPFRVGEYIETSSIKGKIIDVGLFATELRTADGLYLMAPNSNLWNTPIVNHSREPVRRQELTVTVSNSADVRAAREALLEIVRSDERVEKTPGPSIFSDELSADRTTFKVVYWAKTTDWTETRYHMIDALKDGLGDKATSVK